MPQKDHRFQTALVEERDEVVGVRVIRGVLSGVEEVLVFDRAREAPVEGEDLVVLGQGRTDLVPERLVSSKTMCKDYRFIAGACGSSIH